MFEHLPTPLAFAAGLILTVAMIVCGFTIKMDMDTQTYCNDAVHEFVDKSRSVGYMSPSAYVEMMQKFGNTGNLYEITIQHQSRTAVPYMTAAGAEVDGKYGESFNSYYNNEILDYMFPDTGEDKDYPLKNGDYLKVSFRLKEPTLGSKIIGMFYRGELMTIYGAYGGYVGSTEE